jgi:hypothetical protein
MMQMTAARGFIDLTSIRERGNWSEEDIILAGSDVAH